MKKLTTALSIGLLVFGTAACSNVSKTSASADNQTGITNEAPTTTEAQQDLADAQSSVRRNQLDQDIRAREQRNNFFNNGSAENRSDNDLQSEVRAKLEANLPSSQLTIKSQEGIVTVAGTVPTPEQLAKIKPLAQQIKGVREINVEASVLAARSN